MFTSVSVILFLWICRLKNFWPESIDSNTESGIIGGATAPRKRYDYVVNLVNSRGNWYCGGSLIHEKWVLTAAHCIMDETDFIWPYKVWIGRHDINNAHEDYESFLVESMNLHPDYDSHAMTSDFALLRLSGKSNKSPIVVDDGSYTPSHGYPVTVMGWGSLTNFTRSLSPILMEVDLDVVDSSRCNRKWANIVGPSMLCAGGYEYKSACVGDSGGPVIAKSDRDRKDVLLGVVSFGHYYCTHKAFPNVFGKVSSARGWIEDTIGESLPLKSRSILFTLGYYSMVFFAALGVIVMIPDAKRKRKRRNRKRQKRARDNTVAPAHEAVPEPFDHLPPPAEAELEEAEREHAALNY
mmetsp:Transcript_7574/g.8697  ORF Transcript_7574/g.8697 Transcript_7574/m.8697 type:complete len:353 (-) Transcript_7574:103-1161(-)